MVASFAVVVGFVGRWCGNVLDGSSSGLFGSLGVSMAVGKCAVSVTVRGKFVPVWIMSIVMGLHGKIPEAEECCC